MNDILPKPGTQETNELDLTGHHLKLDIHLQDPWQTLPAFQMMRKVAKENGFSDIEDVLVTVDVTFYGHKNDANIEGLKRQIDLEWLGLAYDIKPRYRKERLEDMPTE